MQIAPPLLNRLGLNQSISLQSDYARMQRSELNKRVKSIFDRKIARSPPKLKQICFGFEDYGVRAWKNPEFFMIAIGKTEYLRDADARFRLFGSPFPGFADNKPNAQGPSAFMIDTEGSIVSMNMVVKDFIQVVHLKGHGGLILSKSEIYNLRGADYHIDTLICIKSEINDPNKCEDRIEFLLSKLIAQGRGLESHAS